MRLGWTALCLVAMGCVGDGTDKSAGEGTDDVADSDDGTVDTDDTDVASGDCWEVDTLLDVSAAPGPGDGYPDPELAGECDGDVFVVTSNAIPHYTFVAMTPNALVENDQHWEIPRSPVLAGTPEDIPLLGQIAFTVTGLPIFGPNEAEFPDPYGDPVYNGITDGCRGHTAFEYHNHALEQKCLTAEGLVAEPWTLAEPAGDEPSPVLAWALDGFPIYGPYGCEDAGCTSVMEYSSGWVQTGDPSTYAWDNNEYVEDNDPATLDQCNGHTGPQGDYHYHATATFPYVLGCFSGTAAGPGLDDGGGDDGGGDAGDAGGPSTCLVESDCVGECPVDSIGCTCADDPFGDGICVPTCVTDDDCPAGGPPGGLTCDEAQGICVPASGAP